MISELSAYIRNQKLFHPDQKVLLTVSGGIDSMVMAELFYQSGFHFGIAHCNFQLRGGDSDGDAAFVKDAANRFGVDFHSRTFQTADYAKKHQISIQMAARDLRKAWFLELQQQMDYDYIATAHHINDALETTLFNLAKGTGIAGVRGIKPKDGVVIRPLMFATRSMISDYALANSMQWREDSSNQSTKYHRNLIRHRIVPELKKINPGLEKTFSRTAAKLRAVEDIYNKEVSRLRDTILLPDGNGYKIKKNALKSMDHGVVVLDELLHDFGFGFAQVADIMKTLSDRTGKVFYSNTHSLVIDRQYLILQKTATVSQTTFRIFQDTTTLQLQNSQLVIEQLVAQQVNITKDSNTAFFDYDLLKFPLEIRKWNAGERFQPLGMKHKKKLSDFMIDEKIPLNLKDQQLVLISAGEVVWVVGRRIDDRYKITSRTSKVLKICNENINDQPV